MKDLNSKQQILVLTVTILVLFVGFLGGLIVNLQPFKVENTKIKQNNNSYLLKTVESSTCKSDYKKYYKLDNKTIYTYCLDNIQVKKNNRLIELKTYLETDKSYLNKLVNIIDYMETYDDGSKMYRDLGYFNITNHGLTIIACHKPLKTGSNIYNEDIYIGPKTMMYTNNFCSLSSDLKMQEFMKTYKVLNKNISNDSKYIYLTLKDVQGDEVATVKVLNDLNYDIDTGKNYDFTFEYANHEFEDTIENIFKNMDVVDIKASGNSI